MTDQYDWAGLVMSRCTDPPPITLNNQENFARWMAAENPPHDWWHLNNPLNCGLDDGSADGEGSYPSLDFAATETAQVLSQSNMAPILNALRANAPLSTFSAGCSEAAWSTGGYHGHPDFIASVPLPELFQAPESVAAPPVVVAPAPTSAPTTPAAPPPPPQIMKPLEGKYGMLNAPVVAVAMMPTNDGYTLVGSDGGTFNFGSAPFLGSLASIHLNAPIVDAMHSTDGKGLIMVATDGGIFCMGDVPFEGSEGGRQLNAPAVSLGLSPDGKGYVVVCADGGVFTFGDAAFKGSAVNL